MEFSSTGQTVVTKSSGITYDAIIIEGSIWNGIGNFEGNGFDFRLERDASVEFDGNIGVESFLPHTKLSWVGNTGVTTIATQNKWYKINLFNTPTLTYTKKFGVSGNQLTYYSSHSKDLMGWISGSVTPDSNAATNWQVAVIKNSQTGTTYGMIQVTTDQNARAFNFSTNVYMEDATKNDYYEIWIKNTSNNNVNATCGYLNLMLMAR